MALADLLLNTGQQESFLAEVIYLAEKADITTFPPITVSPATNGDFVTRTGTLTMAASKVFNSINILPGKGDVKIETKGDEQMQSTEVTVDIEVAGVDAAKIGWFRANKNKSLVLVAADRNGLQMIYGDEQQGCYITKISGSLGKDRGFKFTITYKGRMPAVWAGVVPLV